MKSNSFAFIPCRGSAIFPVLLLLLFLMNLFSVNSTYVYHKCDNSSTFTDGNTYSTNLNLVINDLFLNAPENSGYNTSSRGQSPNEVYRLLQCTGKISAVRCSNCLVEANSTIRNRCANDIGGRIWNTTTGLLSNLSDKAYIPANKGFAAGTAKYNATTMLYGLAQCWRDISIEDCKSCLFKARTVISNFSNEGIQVQLGSCKARLETYPFLDSAESPSPSPEGSNPTASTPPPSPTVTPSLNTSNGTSATTSKKRHGISPESDLLMQDKPFLFGLEMLAEATENFHEKNKLGEGGFGVGKTRDGNEIAVKKLSVKSTQGKKEFMNEVKLVANVQHRNLAKLLGCCAEGGERMLVYQYFPNKSLDTFLFDSEKGRELYWLKRHNIITGIARGLLYLHQDSQLRIVHRDIKVHNILLDEKLNPKIADFGLAKLFPEDETHIHTRVAGTYGYIPPEYAARGHLSVKVDVYSFGVVLLKIISGRKHNDTDLPDHMQNLLEWDDATLRPAMSDVVVMLSSNSVTLPDPSKPAFVTNRESYA
ncbi:hypothetical protein SUGI_0357380 [Cryptomeria japonica]|nr:hypothetical protein SUGI_0357380 [Cryptomeria japonica]